jgi:hypothetical protein
VLADNNMSIGDGLNEDSNKAAYKEILDKVRDDKEVYRNTTVKSLLDYFSKKPYGWRDLDIQGMIACLWKYQALVISIHDHVVDENNTGFKNDIARKNNVDTMVVQPKEIIDDKILYQVKRIMNDVYSENLALDEAQLKAGIVSFFDRKKNFLSTLKTKYGTDYAGSKAAAELYQDFQAILKTNDALTIFNEVIKRADSLEDNAETLEQLESFYKEGSHQQKNYQDALKLIRWYDANRLLEDLSRLDSVVDSMQAIIDMEMPFLKMNELANLVFKANEIRDQILQDKYRGTVYRLEQDKKTISREFHEASVPYLTASQLARIQEKADELASQYETWLASLTQATQNMDSYITASSSSVSGFRKFITDVINEGTNKTVRSKSVSVIDCIPSAGKKVKSAEDVEKVLDAIRAKLLNELQNNDEVVLH